VHITYFEIWAKEKKRNPHEVLKPHLQHRDPVIRTEMNYAGKMYISFNIIHQVKRRLQGT
jgi:hypothetical protein